MMRCVEITLRHRAPLAVNPLGADTCALHLVKGSTATQILPAMAWPDPSCFNPNVSLAFSHTPAASGEWKAWH